MERFLCFSTSSPWGSGIRLNSKAFSASSSAPLTKPVPSHRPLGVVYVESVTYQRLNPVSTALIQTYNTNIGEGPQRARRI